MGIRPKESAILLFGDSLFLATLNDSHYSRAHCVYLPLSFQISCRRGAVWACLHGNTGIGLTGVRCHSEWTGASKLRHILFKENKRVGDCSLILPLPSFFMRL